MTDLIPYNDDSLRNDFEAIQNPMDELAIRNFVVGQHHTKGRQWEQATLEIQNRAFATTLYDIGRKIQLLKAAYYRGELKLADAKQKINLLKAEKITVEIASSDLARLGTVRNIGHLSKIKNELETEHNGRGWTHEELEAERGEYWEKRLSWQAQMDINATGRVGVGNQDALRMAGLPIPVAIEQTERRYLESDPTRILVVTPTLIPVEFAKRDGMACHWGWQMPGTIQHRYYVVVGKPIAEAYAEGVNKALADGCTHILTVEDDHVIPQGTFERLWELHRKSGPRSIVGAWYPQRKEPRAGVPIVMNSRREFLSDDGAVHEVHSCPMGFTLIPTSIFRELPQPWFVTSDKLTQDSFFSQLARDAGYKLLVDAGARIKHVDRTTGRVYE